MGGGDRLYGIHLHLGSPALLVPANQAEGLKVWDAVRHVTVTGEELHQDVLRALEPGSGPAGTFPILAGLDVCEIVKGKYEGERTVEVQVNGRRVGQLTKAQANKYLSLVEADLAREQRPGCHAYVTRTADKGLQVTVLLPDVAG
jgi:hypothetical protein